MYLETLDVTVIALYFAGLLGLGVVASRQQSSQEDYYLAGRKAHWLLAGVSVVATLLSSVSYVMIPGEMIRNGIGYFSSLLAFVLIIPVVNYIVIPSLMRLPVTSIYEYLERRFGVQARCLGASVFVVIRLIWMGLILYTAARAIVPMTGWPLLPLVVMVGLVTVIYTTMGGIRAVLWSDFAQFVILIGGALLIPCYIAVVTSSSPGDWWHLFASGDRASTPIFSWNPTTRTTLFGMVLVTFMWNICTHSSDQVAAQRYLCTSSAAKAQRSFWIFSLGNIGIILLLMTCGLALFYFRFHSDNLPMEAFQKQITVHADDVMPRFIARNLPAGATGLILAALLAAAMSSVSSGINSISAVIVSDLMAKQDDDETQSHSLLKPRLLALASGVIAISGALCVDALMHTVDWNLVDLIERINHLFVAPLGAIFFAGIWFRHVGLAAVMLGFAAGVITSLLISFSQWLFDYDISFMWILPGSFLMSLLVAYLSGYLFTPPSQDQLAVLYRPRNARTKT